MKLLNIFLLMVSMSLSSCIAVDQWPQAFVESMEGQAVWYIESTTPRLYAKNNRIVVVGSYSNGQEYIINPVEIPAGYSNNTRLTMASTPGYSCIMYLRNKQEKQACFSEARTLTETFYLSDECYQDCKKYHY